MGVTYIPSTLDEALHLRAEKKARPLAGGSDLMVQSKRGIGLAPEFPFDVMIITGLKELKGIRKLDDGSVEIGALSTPAEIADSDLVPWHVRQAASGMGAIALRNSATIGGNIGNASPKGDLPQPLILLDASVVLASIRGERQMLLDDFILGSKKTALGDDEIIKSIVIEAEAVDKEVKKARKQIENAESEIEQAFSNATKNATKILRLNDSRIFNLSIGRRVVSNEVVQNGRYLVVSANVHDEFGRINHSVLDDFSVPSILWGIDGDWMVNYIEKTSCSPQQTIVE